MSRSWAIVDSEGRDVTAAHDSVWRCGPALRCLPHRAAYEDDETHCSVEILLAEMRGPRPTPADLFPGHAYIASFVRCDNGTWSRTVILCTGGREFTFDSWDELRQASRRFWSISCEGDLLQRQPESKP